MKKKFLISVALISIVILLYFCRIPFQKNCCDAPVIRWKFALYTSECNDESGCNFNKIEKTGLGEYLSLKDINCPCSDFENPNKENASVDDSLPELIPYEKFLENVKTKRKTITEINEAKNYLFEIFDNNIPEYWIGTKWDFNGTTREPKIGAIACGYFITNILTDIGFEIHRTKLAQAPSSEMINNLCVNIKRLSEFDELIKYIQQQPDNSILLIGLDFHTGFILKTKAEIFFLHSNYIYKEGVIKEKIEKSLALKSSKSFMIGNLSENKGLITKWMTSE